MPDDKKVLCPDCEKEIKADDESCPHCQYPILFHNARSRVKALEQRKAKEEEERKKKEEPSKKRRMGGIL